MRVSGRGTRGGVRWVMWGRDIYRERGDMSLGTQGREIGDVGMGDVRGHRDN